MESIIKASDIIKKYKLTSHPEGGYFSEVFRSELKVFRGSEERSSLTSIYFLLENGQKSHFHRLTSDETWHFYLGDPLKLYQISKDGKLSETILGKNIFEGESLQLTIPAGVWFAAHSLGEFSFVGCNVGPGFDFSDFELATKDLAAEFTEHQKLISDFTL